MNLLLSSIFISYDSHLVEKWFRHQNCVPNYIVFAVTVLVEKTFFDQEKNLRKRLKPSIRYSRSTYLIG